jgi:hypothetical protein
MNTNGARLEIVSWLKRMALDVIGLAGKLDFSYDLGRTNDPDYR